LTEKEEEVAFNKVFESHLTENSHASNPFEEQTKDSGFDEIFKLSEEEEKIENLNSIKELEPPLSIEEQTETSTLG